MQNEPKERGYLIVHQDWYELPDETDPLKRHARVTTLNPEAFRLPDNAQLLKHCYEVREVDTLKPFGFTFSECDRIGETHYESLEEACDFVRGLGVRNPGLGFNPVG